MPFHARSRLLATGLLVAILAAVAGVLAGHLVWSATTASPLSAASSRLFGGFGRFAPGAERGSASGAGEAGSGESASGSGAGVAGGSGSSSAAGSGSGVSSSVTAKVDPALVDIDTHLGLEGGEAAGTGMVVTSSGEVITNNHVITGATTITATDVGNGKTYTARVVGYDASHDIAVLALEGASGLQTVSFGDSSSVRVGQALSTIGNARGVGGTPSAAGAEVAALNQSITAGDELYGDQEHLSGLIQLDGDLEPGDSGGPLVNSSGEVVGMDSAASSTFRFESSGDEGFAIPSDEVETIASEIVAGNSSSTIHVGATGFLGVFVASQRGEGGLEGVLVEDVLSGTPAAASGLSAGDVITSVDGSSVSSPTDLTDLILQRQPGESVKVTWQTPSGTQQTATITLASGPPQ